MQPFASRLLRRGAGRAASSASASASAPATYAVPAGWVDARKFASGAELWAYLAAFDPDAPGACAPLP